MATYYRSGSEWVPDGSATFDASFLGNGATIYLTGSSPSTAAATCRSVDIRSALTCPKKAKVTCRFSGCIQHPLTS